MTLAFYTGSATGFNVRKTTQSIGKLLTDEFDLQLLTSKPGTFYELENQFEIVNLGNNSGKLGNLGEIYRYLERVQPDVLTTIIMPHQLGIIAAVAARAAGVPHVYRYPSNDFVRYKTHSGWRRVAYFGLNNVIGRVTLPLSSKYIVLGTNGYDHLRERGVDGQDIEILPQPIDKTRFTDPNSVQDFPVPSGSPVALFIGRRTWLKGYDILEESIPHIIDERQDLHILIVGCGERMPTIPSCYHNNVHPIGDVHPDKIPAYFDRADILLVTSRGEGLPRVILESVIAGTPVIAPPVGEIQDVISNPYSNKEEFINRVIHFENEVVDEAQSYTTESLKQPYINFYREYI